jgi:hypothetical protein
MAVPQGNETPVTKPSGSLVQYTDEATFHHMMVLFGGYKVGKTTFVGSVQAAGKRVLVLDGDLGGSETLSKLHIPFIPVSSLDVFEEAMDWLQAEGHKEYDVVAIDTGSGLQETMIEGVLERGITTEYGAHYGAVRDILVHRLRELRKKDLFLLVTAHERKEWRVVGQERQLSAVIPQFSPKVWDGLNLMTSFIGRMSLIQGEGDGWERRIDFRAKPVYLGGDRLDLLPGVIDDPDWAKIVKALEG